MSSRAEHFQQAEILLDLAQFPTNWATGGPILQNSELSEPGKLKDSDVYLAAAQVHALLAQAPDAAVEV